MLVTLDITPEVVEEAARKGCGLIVSHHPVIFSPLKKLSGQDVAFQLVKNGISAICMHTNLDAAEGGVNEVLAGIFGMREMEAFAEGCGRVGSIEPITVPELAKKAQKELASRCNQPFNGPAVQIKFADTGKTVRRLAVISGAGGSLFEDAIARGADCLLTGEANHHHAIDAKRLGLSLIAAGHYATEFPVTAAVAFSSHSAPKPSALFSATRSTIFSGFRSSVAQATARNSSTNPNAHFSTTDIRLLPSWRRRPRRPPSVPARRGARRRPRPPRCGP